MVFCVLYIQDVLLCACYSYLLDASFPIVFNKKLEGKVEFYIDIESTISKLVFYAIAFLCLAGNF